MGVECPDGVDMWARVEGVLLSLHDSAPVGAADCRRVGQLELGEPAVDREHVVEQAAPDVGLHRWEAPEQAPDELDVAT